jgi:lysophospholipase L1-like esterase
MAKERKRGVGMHGASFIVALALSALLLAGAGLQPAAATTSPHLRSGDRYVSLGSSIASGYGISVQSTTCGRSSRDYGQLVAQHFHLHLVDASCGAALIEHVVDTPQGSNPPQLTLLTPTTKLVTVAVGGNDIDYNATAVACGGQATCAAPPNLTALVANMRVALKAMIEKIKTAAPSATIVFVTYPREVPAGKKLPCPRLHQLGGGGGGGGAFHGPDAGECLRSGRQAPGRDLR